MRVLVLLAAAGAAAAQDFSVPSTWRKPNVTQSRADRIAIAQKAINYTNSFYDNSVARYNFSKGDTGDDTFIDHNQTVDWARLGASSLRYTAMHDLVAGTAVYQGFVTGALKSAVSVTPVNANPSVATIFGIPGANLMTETFNQIGLAAYYAYRAYNDSAMLAVAQSVQQAVASVSSYEANPTTYPDSQVNILKCASTGLGGVILPYLYGNAPASSHLIQNGWVQSSDWAAFMALSAYLGSVSQDASDYKESALNYYNYLTASSLPLVNNQTFFANSIMVYNATAGNKEDPNAPIYSDSAHNFTNCGAVEAGSPSAGVFVEALAAYANLTSNPSVQQQLVKALAAATSAGLSADGILEANHPVYLIGRGGHLAGLTDTLLYTTNETLRAYVQAYANVQFNALQDNALNPDGTSYGNEWATSADFGRDFDPYYQLEAIPALNLAIGPVSTPTASATPGATGAPGSSAPAADSSSKGHGTVIGAAVGAVGGVLLGGGGIVLLLCMRRRRRRRARAAAMDMDGPARGARDSISPTGFVAQPYDVQLRDTRQAQAGVLLASGGAARAGKAKPGTSSAGGDNSDKGSARGSLDGRNEDEDEEAAEMHDQFIDRIPTRHLARILHQRVTGAEPGDDEDFEWPIGGNAITAPPSYHSRRA